MAIAKGITRPRNDLLAAKYSKEAAPKIDPAEPEAIEGWLDSNGPCRRVATVFLSRIWSVSAKDIAENREFAVAMAAEFLALEESRGSYFSLAAYLEEAYARIRAALQKRPDFELILAAAASSRHE